MRLSILVVLFLSITGIYGYTVVGNKIKDPTGAQVTLRGVDRPSFEWNPIGEKASLSDYTLMRAWGANVVRISLNQQSWMTISAYPSTIDQQIAWVTQLKMGVILDLHWNDNNGQHNMADSGSITFWSQLAARYKGNPWIMFELYNEPHDVSWSTWLSGDSSYAGMQQLYNAVRAAGADNLCIVGGLKWAFDLSGVSSGYAVAGTNIAYATHPYDFEGKQQADWPVAFGNLASTYPVIMTEFGQYCASNTYVSDLLVYAESLGIHWTAWAWYVSDCSFPSIISDWNGTPSSGVGELVKRYLSGNGPTAGPTQAPSTTGSSSGSSGSSTSQASSAMVVYTDSLASGWQDWSWSTSYSIADSTYAHSGSKSIKFELVSYQGVYYRTSSIIIGLYDQLVFFVNGGTSTKAAGLVNVKIYGTAGTQIGNAVPLTAAATANQWTQISIPITAFGVASSTQIVGLVIQSTVSNTAGLIWIDDISLVPSSGLDTAPTPTSAPTVAPTAKPTSAPTAAPTAAPTVKPTSAPTAAPTVAPTVKPTSAPTAAPTVAPTVKPTAAPTAAPTVAPTAKPTSAPTGKPTTIPTTAPTTRPISSQTITPTTAPVSAGSSCGPSSVYFVQTVAGSWQSGTQTVTQYTLEIHNTCSNKNLVALTMTPSNWNTVNSWNIVSSGSSLSLPAQASVSSATPYIVGYQSVSGQASFSVSSATFQ